MGKYVTVLNTAGSATVFANAPLPEHAAGLEELSIFMADMIAKRCVNNGGRGYVYSPVAHPCYPHWLPAGYEHAVKAYETVQGGDKYGHGDMEM